MAQVTSPLVIAKSLDGSDVYLYEGATVPQGLREGEEKRLTDAGLVSADKSEDEGDQPAPDDDAGDKPARKSSK